jgi:hypothetical protein
MEMERAPDQGGNGVTGGRPGLNITESGIEIYPTFSPLDLNLVLNSQFSTKLSTYFIIDQYIEKICHNSQLRTTRLSNYHALIYSEIDSYLILGL